MRKKEIPEMMIKAVMSLHKQATTEMKVRSSYSDEFFAKVGVLLLSVLSPFLFVTVIDLVTEEVRKDSFHEILYLDDLVLLSNSVKGIRKKFANWKDSSESKGLKINNQKTKLMVSYLL